MPRIMKKAAQYLVNLTGLWTHYRPHMWMPLTYIGYIKGCRFDKGFASSLACSKVPLLPGLCDLANSLVSDASVVGRMHVDYMASSNTQITTQRALSLLSSFPSPFLFYNVLSILLNYLMHLFLSKRLNAFVSLLPCIFAVVCIYCLDFCDYGSLLQ